MVQLASRSTTKAAFLTSYDRSWSYSDQKQHALGVGRGSIEIGTKGKLPPWIRLSLLSALGTILILEHLTAIDLSQSFSRTYLTMLDCALRFR